MACEQFMLCHIEIFVEFLMDLGDPTHVMPVKCPKLRDGMPLLRLDQRRMRLRPQHLSRCVQQASQAQPIQALQNLESVLSSTVGEQQLWRCRKDFFGALVKPEVVERALNNCVNVVDVAFRLLPARGDDGERSVRQSRLDDGGAEIRIGALRTEEDELRHC